MRSGKVYLVGAGPGDPRLITVRGLECIKEADVIVYDRLVDRRLLDEAHTGTELIYAGKEARSHAMKQNEINSLLIDKAREGKVVVRLKGGDPFIFGRGGEEAEALAAHHIPFEVIPGIPAGVAVPAYAGIPVTHRGLASSFAMITGHEDPTKGNSSIAWDRLATGVDTLVFLMGIENLPQIVEQLIKHGRSPATPVALIHNGTGHGQQTIIGELKNIVSLARESALGPPAVIVVGNVVRLRDKLRWFDNSPLFGKRVLVTRVRHQASALSKLLGEHGAEPVEMPVMAIEEISDYGELDQAILTLSHYHWVIFTSVNGVQSFFTRLGMKGMDTREFKDIKLCAIGPATAAALEEHGLKVDYMPPEYTSEAIAAGFQDKDIRGKRVLLPRSEIAPDEIIERLTGLGAEVKQVSAYTVTLAKEGISKGKQLLLEGKIDIVTFTSSSTVRNLVSLLGDDKHVLDNTIIACIGPVTAAAAAELGLKVDIVAGEHTIPGLVDAIMQKYNNVKGGRVD